MPNNPNSSSLNAKSTLSPELLFLIACCQTKPSEDDINFIQNLLSTIDYAPSENALGVQQLTTMAYRHGILPLVYKALKNLHTNHRSQITDHRLLSNFLTDLKSAYTQIAQRNMLMTAELIILNKKAKVLGINLLPFKGPALAQIAYGDITLRQFSDLDILIKRKDFRKFAPVMLGKDYKPYFPIETFTGDKVMFNMNNDCPFYDTNRGLSIEIHWDFFRKLALPTEKFKPWKETLTVTINGYELQTLSYETLLLYHSLHGSKHVWERLGWIVDIDRLIRVVPKLDWDMVLNKANNIGAQKMFLLGITLAERYFQTPLPKHIQDLCEDSDLEPFIIYVEAELNSDDPAPEDSLVKLSKVIGLRDTFYHKAATLLGFIFQPGINERRTIILPDNLFWLYWLIRPISMGYRLLFCRLLHLCGATNEK